MSNTLTTPYLEQIRSRMAPSLTQLPVGWLERSLIVAAGTLTKGRAFPWFDVNRDRIIEDEGGWAALVESLVGRAVLYVLEDGSLEPAAATFQAVDDWKKEIRSQYDYRSEVISIEDLRDAWAKKYSRTWKESDNVAELAIADQYSFDMVAPSSEGRRALAALSTLTDMQREAFEMYASGKGYQEIANLMGLASRQQAYHLVKRARIKLREELA